MRMGINIPDELYQRYKPLKSTFSLTQICKDAIKSRVESYEKAINQANSDGMEAIAKRLWQEYANKTILDWEVIGRNDAKEWAKLATLEDFENLFHNVGIRKKKGGDLGAFLWYRQIPGAKRFEDHLEENKVWFDRQWELDETSNPHIIAKSKYYEGWFLYITAVWQMVKDKITSDTIKHQMESEIIQDKIEVPRNLKTHENPQQNPSR
jgi:hypothetical protein